MHVTWEEWVFACNTRKFISGRNQRWSLLVSRMRRKQRRAFYHCILGAWSSIKLLYIKYGRSFEVIFPFTSSNVRISNHFSELPIVFSYSGKVLRWREYEKPLEIERQCAYLPQPYTHFYPPSPQLLSNPRSSAPSPIHLTRTSNLKRNKSMIAWRLTTLTPRPTNFKTGPAVEGIACLNYDHRKSAPSHVSLP